MFCSAHAHRFLLRISRVEINWLYLLVCVPLNDETLLPGKNLFLFVISA